MQVLVQSTHFMLSVCTLQLSLGLRKLRFKESVQVKVVMKEVANTQYVACMNPTAGSFHITPRMQRHFVTLAVHMPSPETVR